MNNTAAFTDLTDSLHDEERLQGDNAVLDLPSVSDIPGQEHIRPLPAGEMADTTISSADEEGAGILDFEDEDEEDEDEDEELEVEEIDLDEESTIADDEMALDEEDMEGIEMMDEDEIGDKDEIGNEDEDVTAVEKELLDDAATFTPEEEELNLNRASLDNTDDEGDLLNEGANDKTGEDLDVPGSELDVADEATGEEDEENNVYSMAQK